MDDLRAGVLVLAGAGERDRQDGGLLLHAGSLGVPLVGTGATVLGLGRLSDRRQAAGALRRAARSEHAPGRAVGGTYTASGLVEVIIAS